MCRAIAAVGIAIDHDRLFRRGRVKVGDHDFRDDGTFRYNPRTGAATWQDGWIPIYSYRDGDETFLGFSVVRSCVAGQAVSHVFCVAEPAMGSEGFDCCQPIDFQAAAFAKKALKSALEPLGLWNELAFGLHAILID